MKKVQRIGGVLVLLSGYDRSLTSVFIYPALRAKNHPVLSRLGTRNGRNSFIVPVTVVNTALETAEDLRTKL